MQSEKLTYREVRKAVKDTLKHEGVLSLWKGLGPSLLRDVPFSGKDCLYLCQLFILNLCSMQSEQSCPVLSHLLKQVGANCCPVFNLSTFVITSAFKSISE